MKIRTGFVSNSSSSSFIVIGKSISIKEVMNNAQSLIKQGRLYGLDDMWASEGSDLFPITTEMFELHKKHGAKVQFFDIQELICEEGDIEKKQIKGDTFHVFTIERTHHWTRELEDFVERYLNIPTKPPPAEIQNKVATVQKLQKEIADKGYKITRGGEIETTR